MLKVLDLFSGIGTLSLGLERAGMQTAAFCEIDPYCRKVLNKHWPNVPCYDDVKTLTVGRLAADGITGIDVICGGFPCQDLSRAGFGAGLDGERSGLWFEFARLIGEIRPRFAIVENVAALLDDGMGRVLGSLAGLRYDAEWSVVSACAMGAPHMRRRVFIVAYPHGFHGRPRLRDSAARKNRTLQAGDNLESSRAGVRARLENPSELYRNADGLAFGMDRNRALGNSIYWKIPYEIGSSIVSSLSEGAV
jgi:DNA (cytosine-5)-methyltransferase 1